MLATSCGFLTRYLIPWRIKLKIEFKILAEIKIFVSEILSGRFSGPKFLILGFGPGAKTPVASRFVRRGKFTNTSFFARGERLTKTL